MEEKGLDIRERFKFLDEESKEWVERFYRYLKFRGYAESSIKLKVGGIKRFLREGGIKDLRQVGRREIEGYLQRSSERGLAGSTINATLSGMNHLYRYLQDEGEGLKGPVEMRRDYVRLRNRLPRPMKDEEIERLFEVIRSKRDKAMYMLMLRCGLRVSEVSKLKIEEIDMKRNSVRVNNGKGGIDRVVYSSEDVERSIKEWKEEREEGSEYLFPTARWEEKDRGLGTRWIQRLLEGYMEEAGLGGKGYSCHNLRHSYATQLINVGLGIGSLQELMGHRSMTETMKYVKLYDSTKREEYFEAMKKIQERNKII